MRQPILQQHTHDFATLCAQFRRAHRNTLFLFEGDAADTAPHRTLLLQYSAPAAAHTAPASPPDSLDAQHATRRGLLRLLGAALCNQRASTIALNYGQFGKPTLITDTPLFFSLSHVKDKFLIVASPFRAVGVDCERIRAIASFKSIMQFMGQRRLADTLPDFFRFWVRYEATVKYFGQSLLNTHFQIPAHRKPINRCISTEQSVRNLRARYTLLDIPTNAPYLATVAVAAWRRYRMLSCALDKQALRYLINPAANSTVSPQ